MLSRSTPGLNLLRRSPLGPVAETLRTALALHKTRIALSRLDANQLCDIGLTRSDVKTELQRSAWDIPRNFPRSH